MGPRPFTRDDASRFFGRERETAELFSLIAAHRTVLLYAQSGAGKTSLLNAALIPSLEAHDFDVLPPTRVSGALGARDVAGETNVFVFNCISRLLAEPPSATTTMSEAFERIPRRSVNGHSATRVLVLDQFEELFTAYPERWQDRRGFFEQLDAAMDRDRSLRVLFVIREDFLALLGPYEELVPEDLRTQYRLEKLRPEGALEAVTRPLDGTHVRFNPGVAARLVTKLRRLPAMSQGTAAEGLSEFVEPVQLQIVCFNLFRNLPAETTEIDDTHLAAFADVDAALAAFYQQALDTAAAAGIDEDALRQWFDTKLITEGQTRGLVYRGAIDTAGIPNSAVERLDSLHIIRPEIRGRDCWYELSHDRLVQPILNANSAWRQRQGRRAALKKWRSALIACMVIAVILTTYLLLVAESQRRQAEFARRQAESARQRAEASLVLTTRALDEANTSRQALQAQAQQAVELARRHNVPLAGATPSPVQVTRAGSSGNSRGVGADVPRQIKHVIVLMLENRSFDHMLGYASPQHSWDGVTGAETNPDSNGSPIAVSPSAAYQGQFDPDPNTTYAGVDEQLYNGDHTPIPSMTGFVRSYFRQMRDVDHSHLIMSAFAPDKLVVLTTLAKQFAVCDRWFSSVPGPSMPNHVYAHYGTSFGRIDSQPLYETGSTLSIFERLVKAGRTAKIYTGTSGGSIGLFAVRPELFNPIAQFVNDAANGNLPDYSFVEPVHFDSLQNGGVSLANDQHPDHHVLEGERLIATIYNAVRNSPLWTTSVLLVTYSNHGGFYDHVAPPSTVNPDGRIDQQTRFDFTRLGVRVPAIIISPYVAQGTVVHDVFDHSSIPATVSKLFIGRADQALLRERQATTFDRWLTLATPRLDAPLFQ